AAAAARSAEQPAQAAPQNQPPHHDRPVASNTPHRLAARDTKFVSEGSTLREAWDVRARSEHAIAAGAPLHPFDGDHPPNAGALADRPGLPIILRLEPSLNRLERSKLDDHEALRHPIPFEDPHGAAACNEPP